MRAVIKGALAAALLAGSSLAGTAPAEARDHTGTAVLAGIIGLGVGAAIASSDHHDRYYGNDGYGYSSGYGYDAPVNYYSAPAYSYGVTYDRGYYDRGSYGRGYDRHDRRDYDRGDRHDHDRGDRDHDRGGWDHDRR